MSAIEQGDQRQEAEENDAGVENGADSPDVLEQIHPEKRPRRLDRLLMSGGRTSERRAKKKRDEGEKTIVGDGEQKNAPRMLAEPPFDLVRGDFQRIRPLSAGCRRQVENVNQIEVSGQEQNNQDGINGNVRGIDPNVDRTASRKPFG